MRNAPRSCWTGGVSDVARISVEQKALTDPRFAALGRLMKAPDGFSHDIGLARMIRVWNECAERETYILPAWAIESIFDSSAAPQDLVTVELAEWASEDTLRIRGTEGRTDYLGDLRKARVKGGLARSAGATRDPKTGTFTSTIQQPTSSPPAESSVLTLTPALTPTQDLKKEKKNSCRKTATNAGANGGFMKTKDPYPHVPGRSNKAEALKVWKQKKLDPLTDNVLAWIEYMKQTPDWQKDDGQFVPAFQKFLRQTDFTEPPPPPQEDDYEAWVRETAEQAEKERQEREVQA